jgi:hypothetical protein
MKEIKINGNKYFYQKICSREYVNPVRYLFYVLKEESRVDIVKRRRFILFGPLVDVEMKKEAVYNFVFRTGRMGEFAEFPIEEVKRLEKAFCVNKEIENSIVSI